MDVLHWLQIAAAVMLGNLGSAFIAYALWRWSKHEAENDPNTTMAPGVYLMLLIPMGLAGVVVYTLEITAP